MYLAVSLMSRVFNFVPFSQDMIVYVFRRMSNLLLVSITSELVVALMMLSLLFFADENNLFLLSSFLC